MNRENLFSAPHVGRIPNGNHYKLFVDAILHGRLRNLSTKWRVSPISDRSVREYESQHILGTFADILEWLSCGGVDESHHPCASIPANAAGSVSLYADYKYFHDMFRGVINIDGEASGEDILICRGPKLLIQISSPTIPPIYEQVFDWADMGIPHISAASSTFWLGTAGCHTPLHYDSYGCNVILQLHGIKQWHIWLPTQRNDAMLSPIRIPYEESSVYADRSCFDPMNTEDLSVHPPDWTITLREGEVLYLPKHCWHFVQTISDLAMSVNAWVPFTPPPLPLANPEERIARVLTVPPSAQQSIRQDEEQLVVPPQDDDMYDRATEAICRFAVGSMLHALTWPGPDSGECCDGDYEDGFPGDINAQQGWITPSATLHADEEGMETGKGSQDSETFSRELIELLDHDTNMRYVLHSIREVLITERRQRLQALRTLSPGNSGDDEIGGDCKGGDGNDGIFAKEVFQKLIGTIVHPTSLRRSLRAILESVETNTS